MFYNCWNGNAHKTGIFYNADCFVCNECNTNRVADVICANYKIKPICDKYDERVLKALKNKDIGQAAAIEALRLEIVKE